MTWGPQILIVARNTGLGQTLFSWFTDAGYEVALVTSFAAAKVQLNGNPSLLIAEVRLGQYNGLHLGWRAQARHIPAAVIGEPDVVLERDARQMGVAFLHMDVERQYLLALAAHLTGGPDAGAVQTMRRPARRELAFVSSGDVMPIGLAWRRWRNAASRRMH